MRGGPFLARRTHAPTEMLLSRGPSNFPELTTSDREIDYFERVGRFAARDRRRRRPSRFLLPVYTVLLAGGRESYMYYKRKVRARCVG